MTAEPGGAPRIMFVRSLEPLPLIDPTAAARMLNLRRHTLACYRCLEEGPAYYKFGRWIRYALADLHQWAGIPSDRDTMSPLIPEDWTHAIRLVDTPTAAHFLTVTRHCLANYRAEGSGPPFHRYGRRLYYALHELRDWAERQRR
jgi:hypothetical protein